MKITFGSASITSTALLLLIVRKKKDKESYFPLYDYAESGAQAVAQ